MKKIDHHLKHARDIRRSELFFSYFIRHIRRVSGLSQTELSALCGYSPSYICTVESGLAFANISKSHHIIRVLGYRPETLHVCAGTMAQLMDLCD